MRRRARAIMPKRRSERMEGMRKERILAVPQRRRLMKETEISARIVVAL